MQYKNIIFDLGKVWEIDDILSEGSAKMQANTKEAWSNIKMETAHYLIQLLFLVDSQKLLLVCLDKTILIIQQRIQN